MGPGSHPSPIASSQSLGHVSSAGVRWSWLADYLSNVWSHLYKNFPQALLYILPVLPHVRVCVAHPLAAPFSGAGLLLWVVLSGSELQNPHCHEQDVAARRCTSGHLCKMQQEQIYKGGCWPKASPQSTRP